MSAPQRLVLQAEALRLAQEAHQAALTEALAPLRKSGEWVGNILKKKVHGDYRSIWVRGPEPSTSHRYPLNWLPPELLWVHALEDEEALWDSTPEGKLQVTVKWEAWQEEDHYLESKKHTLVIPEVYMRASMWEVCREARRALYRHQWQESLKAARAAEQRLFFQEEKHELDLRRQELGMKYAREAHELKLERAAALERFWSTYSREKGLERGEGVEAWQETELPRRGSGAWERMRNSFFFY